MTIKMANNKHKDNKSDSVSLDLFVGDEDDEPGSSQQNVVETLCLRILSKSNIKYRFGGLQIHVKSPEFHIGKSFHVNLDENNRIDSIESYREPEDNYLFGRRRVSLLGSNNLSTMPARILITPKRPVTESDLQTASTIGATATNSQTKAVNNGKSTANIVINNGGNMVNSGTNQIKKTQMPILTADVVVEEILDNDESNQDTQSQTSGQSLGAVIVNTLLNKKSISRSSNSSVVNSPSQSVHAINSLSSSMLELRSASPINQSSPEKIISKLTLQPFGHSENRYVKLKGKKFDFRKRSKEKLLKNGEKNENGNKDEVKCMNDRIGKKNVDKISEKSGKKKAEKLENPKEVNSKIALSDHSPAVQVTKCETKNMCLCTQLNASSNLSLNTPQGFFSNLRRTRSWKK